MTNEEAVEKLKILKEDYWDDDGYGHESKLYDDTVVALDMAINALEDSRWIPVTERLPNSNGCYLVWRPHFFGGEIGMPSICYFDGQNTWHDSYGVDFERVLSSDDVVAWMPLPKPYEGSDTE